MRLDQFCDSFIGGFFVGFSLLARDLRFAKSDVCIAPDRRDYLWINGRVDVAAVVKDVCHDLSYALLVGLVGQIPILIAHLRRLLYSASRARPAAVFVSFV
jgi:hypothetical protein